MKQGIFESAAERNNLVKKQIYKTIVRDVIITLVLINAGVLSIWVAKVPVNVITIILFIVGFLYTAYKIISILVGFKFLGVIYEKILDVEDAYLSVRKAFSITIHNSSDKSVDELVFIKSGADSFNIMNYKPMQWRMAGVPIKGVDQAFRDNFELQIDTIEPWLIQRVGTKPDELVVSLDLVNQTYAE